MIEEEHYTWEAAGVKSHRPFSTAESALESAIEWCERNGIMMNVLGDHKAHGIKVWRTLIEEVTPC